MEHSLQTRLSHSDFIIFVEMKEIQSICFIPFYAEVSVLEIHEFIMFPYYIISRKFQYWSYLVLLSESGCGEMWRVLVQ